MSTDPFGIEHDRITSLEIEVRSLEGRVKELEEMVRAILGDSARTNHAARMLGQSFLTDGKGMD